MSTLIAPGGPEPTIDIRAFPFARPEGYWTSTPVMANTTAARWGVGFGGEFAGLVFEFTEPDEFAVTGPHARCVR